MDLEQEVEEWQRLEQIRRNKIRSLTRKVPYPECNADIGHHCMSKRGPLRVSNHISRYKNAKNKGSIPVSLFKKNKKPSYAI